MNQAKKKKTTTTQMTMMKSRVMIMMIIVIHRIIPMMNQMKLVLLPIQIGKKKTKKYFLFISKILSPLLLFSNILF